VLRYDSHRVRARLVCLALFSSICGCGPQDSGHKVRSAARSESTALYLDVNRCWARNKGDDDFRGAVALYESGRIHEAVIYSGLCSVDETLAGMRTSSRVRVRCISAFSDVTFCKHKEEPDEFNEQIFSPGIKPEFPTRIYAVQGHFSGLQRADGSALIFSTFKVSRYQALPREMMGAFLQYPRDRIALVDEYLRTGAHDRSGYKSIF
jgi:hypothetical protein